MPISDEWISRIQARVDDRAIDQEFALEDLMEDVWQRMAIEHGTNPNAIGRMFSNAVSQGHIVRVVEAAARKSPRASMWRRTAK